MYKQRSSQFNSFEIGNWWTDLHRYLEVIICILRYIHIYTFDCAHFQWYTDKIIVARIVVTLRPHTHICLCCSPLRIDKNHAKRERNSSLFVSRHGAPSSREEQTQSTKTNRTLIVLIVLIDRVAFLGGPGVTELWHFAPAPRKHEYHIDNSHRYSLQLSINHCLVVIDFHQYFCPVWIIQMTRCNCQPTVYFPRFQIRLLIWNRGN